MPRFQADKAIGEGNKLWLERFADKGVRLSTKEAQKIKNLEPHFDPITAETAIKLSRFFNNNPQFWLNLQNKYDVWEARQKLGPELGEIGEPRARLVSSLTLSENGEGEADIL